MHGATAAGRTAPARPPAVDKNDKERTESRLLSPLMSNGIAPGGPPALTRPSASVGSFLAGPPPARGSAVVARLGARRIGTTERFTWMRSVWQLAHGPRRRTITDDKRPESLITKLGAAPLIFACSEAVKCCYACCLNFVLLLSFPLLRPPGSLGSTHWGPHTTAAPRSSCFASSSRCFAITLQDITALVLFFSCYFMAACAATYSIEMITPPLLIAC